MSIIIEKKYDHSEYSKEYNRENYRKISVYLDFETFNDFDIKCKELKLKKNDFLRTCIKDFLKEKK